MKAGFERVRPSPFKSDELLQLHFIEDTDRHLAIDLQSCRHSPFWEDPGL